MAAAFAHRVIDEIIGRGCAERRDIALAEALDSLGRELELGDGHEVERAQLVGGALAFRIEAADRLECIAEEIEPDRLAHARRIEVDDAAAHGIVAGLAHGRGAHEAVELEPTGDAFHGEHVARHHRERLPRHEIARRHALERGVDGGDQHGGAITAL